MLIIRWATKPDDTNHIKAKANISFSYSQNFMELLKFWNFLNLLKRSSVAILLGILDRTIENKFKYDLSLISLESVVFVSMQWCGLCCSLDLRYHNWCFVRTPVLVLAAALRIGLQHTADIDKTLIWFWHMLAKTTSLFTQNRSAAIFKATKSLFDL